MTTTRTRYPAPAPRMIPARWKGKTQTPRWIVLHETQSPCATGGAVAVALMFAHTDREASAHYVVDPAEEVQCVPDHVVAYHCGWNQDTLGLEMCGYSSWNLARWATRPRRRMRARAVNLVAELCLAYGIPPYFRGVRRMREGAHGVTTHAVMSKAFKRSTHWDPGAWPRRRFMKAVRKRIAEIENEGVA